MTEWHFFDKVYRVWVVLLVGSIGDFHGFMERSGYKDMDGLKSGSTTGYCINLTEDNNDRGNRCYIIWLHKFETACFVHELAHLVMFVFDDKGVPVRPENTEAFSYYQEFWFNEMQRARRRLPNGKTPAQVRMGK